MLRLVEHELTGETYALIIESEKEGIYLVLNGAWPVPRSAVLHPNGWLWPHWDQAAWERLPNGTAPDGQPLEHHIGAWAETQPWRTLAEV